MRVIHTEPLTPESFAPFGDVMAATGAPDRLINQGFCGRYHDRAQLDFGPDGRAGAGARVRRRRGGGVHGRDPRASGAMAAAVRAS